MTNIALDTNIWIYLTKDTFHELWLRFKQMQESGEIKVIVNDVILKEWTRNKQNTIASLTNAIKNEYKTASNLSNYLTGEAKQNFEKTIIEYKDEESRIAKATQRVEEVEQFMNSCHITMCTQEQKLFIAELAINKLPPFQNNKNNFNDALIFRNIYEFIDVEYPREYDLIYVSNNPADFIDKETGTVHQSLLEGLNPIRFRNIVELGQALQLAPELIADFDDWLEYQLQQRAEYEFDISRGK